MRDYDFTKTADFLDNSVPLGDLYSDVLDAMDNIGEFQHLSRDSIKKIWQVLFDCAGLIDTIQFK